MDDGQMQDKESTEGPLRLRLSEGRDSRNRVPAGLRAEVTAYAQSAQRDGQSYTAVARGLGIKVQTLMRWCRVPSQPRFSKVLVSRPSNKTLTMHGPGGTRIEGLSVEQIATLMKTLCTD